MGWVHSLRRWTMRGFHAAILGAALGGAAGIASAQTPTAGVANLPRQDFFKNRNFDLPVGMEQEVRAKLSEIRLYVKTPTGAWKLHESIAPHQTRFACKVAQDGEYWFLLSIVDKAGKMQPADLDRLPPSRRIVVDTTAPLIQVQPWTSPDGEFCLRCIIQEANPDFASLKAVCKVQPYGEMALERHPQEPGVFRIKGVPPQAPVIVTMRDLAGNVGVKEVNVAELARAAQNNVPSTSGLPMSQPTARNEAPLPTPRVELAPSRLPESLAPMAKNEPASTLPPTRPDLVMPPAPAAPVTPPPVPNFAPPTLTPSVTPPAQIAPPSTTMIANRIGNDSARQPGIPHQLINTNRANVDFRIDQVGPSGVGKVEIYMTPDKGQTWHRLSEVIDRRSPTEINLPGDGEYGIRIAVKNGNGFGGRAPVRGEAPHCTIEVDTLAPIVQLRSTEVLPNSGHVEIRWNAQDKNLGTEPVSLYFSTKPEGPWQVIARNVKNDGVHRWTFPRDVGSQFFFKIEVVDQAGNLTHEASRQPLLIDITEPRATVVGVTGTAGVRQTGN